MTEIIIGIGPLLTTVLLSARLNLCQAHWSGLLVLQTTTWQAYRWSSSDLNVVLIEIFWGKKKHEAYKISHAHKTNNK